MRHAATILAVASAAVLLARATAAQAPSPPAAAAAAPEVKVAGRDVPPPKRTRFVSPVFPPEAQALGQRGIVILELLIDQAGKVASADVLRSVPPFDDAALLAARQWEYEVTKVAGKPVAVRLTVPITFALKLPEMTREAGIPELRQGAPPGFPAGAKGTATVVADVTLLPDGTVAEAAIREGDSPWSEAMLQALRTWRFAADPDATPVSFQVRAQFNAGPPARVDLKLSGLRTAEAPATPPPAAATPPPTVAPPSVSPAVPPATVSAPPPTLPAAAPPPPGPVATPAPAPSATPPAPAPARPDAVRPSPLAMPSPPAGGSTAALGPPVVGTTPAIAATPGPGAPGAPATAGPTPPPVEVIPGGAPPGTPPVVPRNEPGVSAVRDVALGPGVPDLTKGRRPVAPPLARMSGVSGTVQVQQGVLDFTGYNSSHFASSGLFDVSAGASVLLENGAFDFQPGRVSSGWST